MKKKQNTKFRAIDIVITVLCIGGAIASGTAFWMEYNRSLHKLNENPVGTIVFKKHVAQRKFMERLAWDRLRQTSPVYNGDTIRTVEQSEAYISFRDEVTHLNLDENTLIQIFWDDIEGAKIDFTGGNLDIVSSSRSVVIASGASEIRVEGQASLNKGNDGVGLSVLEGQASFDGNRVASGNMLAFDSRGAPSTTPMIAMTSFGSSARVMGNAEGASPVAFSWNTSNFNADTHVIVQVASDRGFNNITGSRDVSGATSVSIPLATGSYYWRAYPANGGSSDPAGRKFPSGTLDVLASSVITLIAPARAAEFTFTSSPAVSFSWSSAEGASAYLLEISANANMGSPVVSRRVNSTSITQKDLPQGRLYWRVTPVFPSWVKGAAPASAVGDFSVTLGKANLAAPVLSYPAQNGKLYIESSSKRLLWIHDPEVSSWLVEIADNPGMANPAVTRELKSNYFTLPNNMVQDGKTWYWRVSAQGGASPAVSATRNFAVSAGNPPSSSPIIASAPPPAPTPPPAPPPPPTPPPAPTPPPPAPTPPAPTPPPPAPTPPPPAPTPPPPAPTPPPPAPTPPPPAPTPPPPAPTPPPPAPTPPPPAPTPPPPAPTPPPVPEKNWLQVSATSGVSGFFPPDGYSITTGQLANASKVLFSWEGKGSEYRYALFRSNGDVVIAPATIKEASYTLANPGLLTEGEYVWQVFERDRRGSYSLPSASIRLTVTRGQAVIRNLPTSDPGALYGNR